MSSGAGRFNPSENVQSHRVVLNVWLLLMALSIAAYLISEFHLVSVLVTRDIEIASIIMVAIVKMALVLAVFMGLRAGPRAWRIGIYGLLVVMALIMLAMLWGLLLGGAA